MGGLIELIFDRVPNSKVSKLVDDVLGGMDILELVHSELGDLDPTKFIRDLLPLLDGKTEPSSIFIRVARIKVGAVSIRSPLIRILRFEGANEVAILFGSADIDAADRKSVVAELAAGAKEISSDADVVEFYCGFEPATDEETGLFFKEKIGPLLTV